MGAPSNAERSIGADPLSVERVSVGDGRLRIDVRLAPGIPHTTDERLAALASSFAPALPFHTCINDRGPVFAAVIAETSVPHLLEHLIIDGQTAHPATREGRRFVGVTRWTDEDNGTAGIEVNFYDDLIALQAVKDAAAALNDMLRAWTADRTGRGEEGR